MLVTAFLSNLNNFSSCGKSWASSKTELNDVKTYFNNVFNGNMLWENPFLLANM